MTPTPYHDGRVLVYPGNCLVNLPEFPEASFDAVVTDPPYHLVSGNAVYDFALTGSGNPRQRRMSKGGFMGKAWDGGQIAHKPETWAAVLRVMKPGAHLVAFHAPRNWHRLAVAIEDAGFEIRDTLLWIFSQGFPKSLNVSKALDAKKERCTCGEDLLGLRRDALGRSSVEQDRDSTSHRPQPAAQRTNESRNVARQPQSQTLGAWPTCERCGKPIVARGLGTALKPAYEPIVLARKPLIGTVAANVMQHGTGAINIDACRVATSDEIKPVYGGRKGEKHGGKYGHSDDYLSNVSPLGRWPANVVHDGSPEVVEGFPAEAGGGTATRGALTSIYGNGKGFTANTGQEVGFGDSGSAARFFYTAKADSVDRLGSKHPTVKPIDLMRWLVRLVTPPGGHILDPFAGTGTTAEAALLEGFRCSLIERESEYLADIDRRMALMFESRRTRRAEAVKRKKQRSAPLFEDDA